MEAQRHPGAIGPGLILHVALSAQDMESVYQWSTALILKERARCHELAAEEQLYPSDADCAAVNKAVQRLMARIENGTTIDDLRSNAESNGALAHPTRTPC